MSVIPSENNFVVGCNFFAVILQHCTRGAEGNKNNQSYSLSCVIVTIYVTHNHKMFSNKNSFVCLAKITLLFPLIVFSIQTYVADIFFGQEWTDHRLRLPSNMSRNKWKIIDTFFHQKCPTWPLIEFFLARTDA